MDILRTLRLLVDPARVRILRLLAREELSVAELQEVLGMGQSRISMQLSQLKQAGFVEARRAGQKSIYRLTAPAAEMSILREVLEKGGDEIPGALHDDAGLNLVLARRRDQLRAYFDEAAGRFGRDYVPGQSWKALAEMLFRLLPPLDILDMGAGEGGLSVMLARSARTVIAVDNSGGMIEAGRELAVKSGTTNLEYRLGDVEELPVESGTIDVALMHQSLHHALHPPRALAEAFRVLRPGGRVVILDLLKHDFEAARDLYADVWPGFAQGELVDLLNTAGFTGTDVSVVDTGTSPPNFQTVLCTACRPCD